MPWEGLHGPLHTHAPPESLVLRRSMGSFGDGRLSLLHVGVTSSRELGVIFNFDEHGCRADALSSWLECTAVTLPAQEDWDERLLAHHERWLTTHGVYCSDKNNCYDYVVSLLSTIFASHWTRGKLTACLLHAVAQTAEHWAELTQLLDLRGPLSHCSPTGFGCLIRWSAEQQQVERTDCVVCNGLRDLSDIKITFILELCPDGPSTLKASIPAVAWETSADGEWE